VSAVASHPPDADTPMDPRPPSHSTLWWRLLGHPARHPVPPRLRPGGECTRPAAQRAATIDREGDRLAEPSTRRRQFRQATTAFAYRSPVHGDRRLPPCAALRPGRAQGDRSSGYANRCSTSPRSVRTTHALPPPSETPHSSTGGDPPRRTRDMSPSARRRHPRPRLSRSPMSPRVLLGSSMFVPDSLTTATDRTREDAWLGWAGAN